VGSADIPGITGIVGTAGIPGIPGTEGIVVARGIPGTEGIAVVPGIPGTEGIVVMPGIPGTEGIVVMPGIPGTAGIAGIPGIPGIAIARVGSVAAVSLAAPPNISLAIRSSSSGAGRFRIISDMAVSAWAKSPRPGAPGIVPPGSSGSLVLMVVTHLDVLEHAQSVVHENGRRAVERDQIRGNGVAVDPHEAD